MDIVMGESRRIGDELRGKTLQVYLHMLGRNSPIGVRELQRALGFSSPSVAYHHIEKLESLGVIAKDEYGRYHVVRRVDVAVLQAFSIVGRFTLPRVAFYAAFFTTLAAAYAVQFYSNLNPHALGFALAGAAAFWYEAVRVWRRKPF